MRVQFIHNDYNRMCKCTFLPDEQSVNVWCNFFFLRCSGRVEIKNKWNTRKREKDGKKERERKSIFVYKTFTKLQNSVHTLFHVPGACCILFLFHFIFFLFCRSVGYIVTRIIISSLHSRIQMKLYHRANIVCMYPRCIVYMWCNIVLDIYIFFLPRHSTKNLSVGWMNKPRNGVELWNE